MCEDSRIKYKLGRAIWLFSLGSVTGEAYLCSFISHELCVLIKFVR